MLIQKDKYEQMFLKVTDLQTNNLKTYIINNTLKQ